MFSCPYNNVLMSLLVIAGIATLVVSYSYFYAPKQTPQSIGINQIVTGGVAHLTIVPASEVGTAGMLELGKTTTMKVAIDGGTTKLAAGTIAFNYDPTKITISNIVKGDFFTEVLSAPVPDMIQISGVNTGRIVFSYGVVPETLGKSGSGNLVSFDVTPKVAGDTTLTFGSATNIRAVDSDVNVLGEADPFSFTTSAGPARLAADIVDTNDVEAVNGVGGDQINAQDYAAFTLEFNKVGTAGWIRSDINKDGKVDIADFAILVRQWSL